MVQAEASIDRGASPLRVFRTNSGRILGSTAALGLAAFLAGSVVPPVHRVALRLTGDPSLAARWTDPALRDGTGVCRDFAHTAIALCRAMSIPARYVNGYLGDIGVPYGRPMDFSAWFEAFIDGRWYAFDARHNVPRIGRIDIAYGRDAADVAMIHSFAPHLLKNFTVVCDEEAALAAE